MKSHMSKGGSHGAGAQPGFRSMRHLRVLLLLPGWDASSLQGNSPAVYRRYPFTHLSGERQHAIKFFV